jgi:pyridoxamine 5'-phosphate oxidase family protein
MSAFTASEIRYLTGQHLGRVATVRADGQPHVVPVGFRYNPDEDAIEIGGHSGFAKRKKVSGCLPQSPAFVVDDVVSVNPWRVRGIEIRGHAEILATGGEALAPGLGLDPEMFRIRAKRIVSWGIDSDMLSLSARSVR